MFLTNTAVIILGLIYLGASRYYQNHVLKVHLTADSAFDAIINAALFGLSLSYLLTIVVLVYRGRHFLPRGRFSLGKAGYPINIFAIIFLMLMYVSAG